MSMLNKGLKVQALSQNNSNKNKQTKSHSQHQNKNQQYNSSKSDSMSLDRKRDSCKKTRNTNIDKKNAHDAKKDINVSPKITLTNTSRDLPSYQKLLPESSSRESRVFTLNSNEPPEGQLSDFWSSVIPIYDMGWGQPAAGKRVRHCSDDNTSEYNGNSENLTEEMKAHFGKRPRDVSPFNGQNSEEGMSHPESRLKTITGDEYSNSLSLGSSSMLTKSRTGSQEYSVNNVIADSNVNDEDDDIASLEGFSKDLRIRTSALKVHLPEGSSKSGKILSTRKGPRVIALCRTRTPVANPCRKNATKRTSKASSKASSTKSSDSTCGSDSATDSGITLADEDDDFYDDIEADDDLDDDVDQRSSEDSVEDNVSAATSEDVIPVTNVISRVVPAIRPSYFPNVPPYLNFCLHDERTETLPSEIQKHMKWRLSPITPVVVKKTLTNSGFRLLRKTVEWNGQCGKHMKAALFKSSLKDFQKLNHLPGTFQIGRKDRLWRNIHRFMTKFGNKEFGFIPRTYVLPAETRQLKAAWDSSDANGQLWIVKPPAGARGTGIRVVNRWNQVPKKKSIIVQSYISNPYLINDRKFDLRLYVLVTSFHPLKIFMYNDGLVRFAPVKYSHDTKRAGDRFMHLTNYSVNKNCELYTHNEDADSCQGHKWTLKTLWRHFQKEGKNTDLLWDRIEEIVVKTLISAEDPITSSAHCLPNRYNGYELFGFDIILDSELKPWLLEVNISPSLHSSSPLDLAVKGPMIKEVFNIVGFHLPPKLSPAIKIMLLNSLDVDLDLETPVFDKRIYTCTLSKEEQTKQKSFKTKYEKRSEYLEEILETLTPDDIRQLIIAEDELSQCENFCRIFPSPSSNSYFPYFEGPRYYNLLFDAWEHTYHENRAEGVKRLMSLCHKKIHLQVPINASSMISENQGPNPSSNSSEVEPSEVSEIVANTDTATETEQIIFCSTPTIKTVEVTNRTGPVRSTSPPVSIVAPISPPAVLDNITNNSTRSLGASTVTNCHDDDRFTNGKTTVPMANKVTDFVKGVCF